MGGFAPFSPMATFTAAGPFGVWMTTTNAGMFGYKSARVPLVNCTMGTFLGTTTLRSPFG